MEFHKAQLEAIRHFNGPCITLAGPGSGKTTVLTYRILNLIEKCGVAPEHILVITFTRAAATEMKERFLKLSDNRYSGVCFQTFHSFFFMILRKAYGYRADNIITQQEQTRFFKNILNEYELEITDTMELIRHATAWISNVKRSGKSPDTQPVAAAGICPQEILCEIYHKYQQYLTAKRLIDFEDMTVYCYDLFSQRKDILWQWQEQYQYILVDEFQDISPQRASLLAALRRQNSQTTLFAVGDDWQAIYRFSGAQLSLTTAFNHYFGEGDCCALDTTYRFNGRIGEIANGFIQQNPHQLSKPLNSLTAGDKKAVTLLADDKLDDLLDKLSGYVKPEQRILLLARYHHLKPEALDKAATRWPHLQLDFMTIHASKGQQADFVIVLGLQDGEDAFPAPARESIMEQALLPQPEDFPDAEERRLLYVALTRARHRVWLLFNKAQPSPFVEILQALDVPVARKP